MPPAARSSGSSKKKATAKKRPQKKARDRGRATAKKPRKPQTEAAELPEVSDEEALALLRAIDAYKRRTGRPFPTWSEVLAIVKSLGYRKVED